MHPWRRAYERALADPKEAEFADQMEPHISDEYVGCLADALAHGDALTAMTYEDYLTTDGWLEYRAAVFARQGGKCATCPRDATHCHHRTYERVGWEADDDCVGLCRDCHAKLHAPTPMPPRRRRRPR